MNKAEAKRMYRREYMKLYMQRYRQDPKHREKQRMYHKNWTNKNKVKQQEYEDQFYSRLAENHVNASSEGAGGVTK